MKLRHFRYFAAVVEEGSFLKASLRLHVSQLPLSTQIGQLEDELGASLLTRSTRGVALTEAGRVFYDGAVAILARLAQVKLATQKANIGESGTLTVAFVSIVDYSILPPALRQFRSKCPGVDVQPHELTTDVQIQELLAGRIDLGLALAPVNEDAPSLMPLYSEKLIIAISGHHPLARKRKSASLRDLSQEPFLLIPRALAPGLHDIVLAFCHDCGFVPKVAQYAKQMQTVISLVAGGFGVALVPKSIENLRRAGVTYLALREPSPLIQVGMIRRMDDDNPIILNFLACARDHATSCTVL